MDDLSMTSCRSSVKSSIGLNSRFQCSLSYQLFTVRPHIQIDIYNTMSESSDAQKYRLKITAGSEYNPDTHRIVPVNETQPLRIDNEHATISLCVRIQDYTGMYFLPTYSHPITWYP